MEFGDACPHAAACRSEGLAPVAQLTVTDGQRKAPMILSETRQTDL